MRRTSPLIRRGSENDIDSAMTPMIDVVFLLLVFFVWTASFQVVEFVLPSNMSELTWCYFTLITFTTSISLTFGI